MRASIGRNDPCPCGSGRKFKRCCATLNVVVEPTGADRELAVGLLARFTDPKHFEDEMAVASELFWGEESDEDGPIELGEDQMWLGGLFAEWCWFDFVSENGGTLAENVLDKHGSAFTPGGRRFVEACVAFPVRLTQVVSVNPGQSVVLRDLLDRSQQYDVRDRVGSEDLVTHDVLAARLVRYGDGPWIIEGTPCRLTVDDRDRLLPHIKRALRKLREHDPDTPPAIDRMLVSVSIAQFVVDRVLNSEAPQLRTTDGDVISPSAIVFEVLNGDSVRHALDDAPDFEGEPAQQGQREEYVWFDDAANNESGRRVLAHAVLTGRQLRVETLSIERAARALARMAPLLGEAVKFAGLANESLEATKEMMALGSPPTGPTIPPAVAAAVERDWYEHHYREWLDQPVPALGGRTPRDAAKVRHLRGRLRTLVEGIENQAARLDREGRGFDVSWLREELGLVERRGSKSGRSTRNA